MLRMIFPTCSLFFFPWAQGRIGSGFCPLIVAEGPLATGGSGALACFCHISELPHNCKVQGLRKTNQPGWQKAKSTGLDLWGLSGWPGSAEALG